jgi:hypothetical protein
MADYEKIDTNTLEVTKKTQVSKASLLSYKQDLLDRKADVEAKLAEVELKLNILK